MRSEDSGHTLDELLDQPCPACQARELVIQSIDGREHTVTLRCLVCDRLQHLVPYTPYPDDQDEPA